MEPIIQDIKSKGRMHKIYMVQRRIVWTDIWQNVKAFVSEVDAEDYIHTCESIAKANYGNMRVEAELLVL